MNFSECLIDFTKCPLETRLVDFFEDLNAFPEFHEANDTEIKIAIATTDMESPCVKIPDREHMMRTLFTFLNLDLKKEENGELFEDVLHYKHKTISSIKSRYVQMQHVTEWAEWLMVNETFNFLITQSNIPKLDTDKEDAYISRRVKIKDDLRKAGRDLKELESKLFPDSKSAREIANDQARKKIISYPEKYAQQRSVI